MEPPVPILHEDNHILCVDKPFGLLTQDSGTDCDNLEDQIKSYYKALLNKKGDVYIRLLHRLDRVTGGVVLFAKTRKALHRLLAQIRKRDWEKTYLVATEAPLPDLEGRLSHYLVHGNKQAFVVEDEKESAKLSHLSYKFVQEKEGIYYYHVKLETGRYHQIRCQLSHLGAPVWGDDKYGSSRAFPFPGIALKHIELKFWHPVQQRDLAIKAPEPKWY